MSNEQATTDMAAAVAGVSSAVESRIPIEVARRVSETITNCEFSIDQAYVATAEYAMLMPSIRGQTKLPFGAAQVAVSRATEALSLLAQAREAIKESHADLNILAKRGGLDLRADLPFPWKW